MHAISSYRGNRPTQTTPARPSVANTQTGPIITIHCAAELSAQCNESAIVKDLKG